MYRFLVIFLALAPVCAEAATPMLLSPSGQLCAPAVDAAEHNAHLPTLLLRSISMVESARQDPLAGRWVAWPWTINAAGIGYFYETKEAAMTAAQAFIAGGNRSIDVGCMQVNLAYHPTAFASLDAAFDPPTNATYAAQYLTDLYAENHSWPLAAAYYHSQTPEIGLDYARKVYAGWPNAARFGAEQLAATSARAPVRDYSRYTPTMAAIMRRNDEEAAKLLAAHTGLPSSRPTAPPPVATPKPLLRLIDANGTAKPTTTAPGHPARS